MKKRRKSKKIIYLIVSILFLTIFGFAFMIALAYYCGSTIDKAYLLTIVFWILSGDALLIFYYITDKIIKKMK